jgi:hypothetical protein
MSEHDGDDHPGITKPSGFSLDRFKSTRGPAIAGVETLQSALSVMKLSEVDDFVRINPNQDTHWTSELCFVSVPIKGQKRETLHLIDEDIALEHLSNSSVKRFRLALASKPDDNMFLAIVPSQNLDNVWNSTNLEACALAQHKWVKVASRSGEGAEGYKTDFARDPDAFPEPRWPSRSLTQLIERSFEGRFIDNEKHPALLRLIGAKQAIG